jgi:hypothetical protein
MTREHDETVRALQQFGLSVGQRHAKELARNRQDAVERGVAEGSVGDFFSTFAKSVGSSFVSGFAGDAKTLDYMFDADVTKDTHRSLKNLADTINKTKSARSEVAAKKKFIKKGESGEYELGKAWSDIYSYAELAGSGVGSIAAMFLVGGPLKAGLKLGLKGATNNAIKKEADRLVKANKGMTYERASELAQKKTVDLAQKYDTALGLTAYGTAESAIVSGSVGQAIEEEIMRAPPEILNQSDRFKEIYFELAKSAPDTDTAHNAARTQLAREAGIEGAKTVSVPSFMLGSVAGTFIEKAIRGRLSESAVKNFAILEAVEMPTEAAQGGVEQFVQNKVYKEYADRSRDVWEDVAEGAIREGLGVGLAVAPLSAITAQREATALSETGETTDIDTQVTEEGGDEEPPAPPPDDVIELDLPSDEDIDRAVETPIDELVQQAADEAATSPENDLKEPTDGQKEAGNYKKGRIDSKIVPWLKGTPIKIENPAGSKRQPEWPVLKNAYGYYEQTEAHDNDEVDVFIGPDMATEPKQIFVVDQVDPKTGEFDEHKVILGVHNAEDAKQTYLDNYEEGWQGIGDIKTYEFDDFKQKLKSGFFKNSTLDRKKRDVKDLTEEDIDKILDEEPIEDTGGGGAAITEDTGPEHDVTPFETPKGITGEKTRGRNKKGLSGKTRISIPNVVMNDDGVTEDHARLRFNADGTLQDVGIAELDPETGKVIGYSDVGVGFTLIDPKGEKVDSNIRPFNIDEVDEILERANIKQVKPAEKPALEEPVEDTGGARTPEKTTPETPAEPAPEPAPEPAEQPAEPEVSEEDKAVVAALEGMKDGAKYVLSGTKQNGAPAKARTIEFMEKVGDVYRFKEGERKRHTVKLDKGKYRLFAGGTTRTLVIQKIEPYVAKGKRTADLEGNIGGAVRRINEMFKKERQTPSEADKLLKAIEAATAKARHLKAVDMAEATPGTQRFVTDLFTKFNTFFDWVGPALGGSRKKHKYSHKEAVLKVLQGEPIRKFGIQTPQEINDAVNSYIDFMQDVRELLNGSKSVRDITERWVAHEFDSDAWWAMNKAVEDGESRHFRSSGISRNDNGFFETHKGIVSLGQLTPATLHKMYKEHLEFENIEQDKFDFKRERHDLQWLNEQRKGMPDMRKGRNITGEQLIEAFGFAGITYGDHVDKTSKQGEISEAQLYRNMVYEAFMDLSFLTGVPSTAIGHNIYLSVGALGRGKKAAAFWSPNWPHVNLKKNNREDLTEILDKNYVRYKDTDSMETLMNKVGKVIERKDARIDRVKVLHFNRSTGDGTLAHEWAHSLGHRIPELEKAMADELKRQVSIPSVYKRVQDIIKEYIKEEDVFSEDSALIRLEDAIKRELMKSGMRYSVETKYYIGSKQIKPASYWANDKELFARATEAYIYDKMMAADSNNPFLQSSQSAESAINPFTGYRGTPYPAGMERTRFNEIFEEIFENVTTNEVGDVTSDIRQLGTHDQLDIVSKGVLESLSEIIKWAADERVEYQLSLQEGEIEDDDSEIKKLTEADLDNLIDGVDAEPNGPEPTGPKRPRRKPSDKKPGPKDEGGSAPEEKEDVREVSREILEDNKINPKYADDVWNILHGKDDDIRFSLDDGPQMDEALYEKLKTPFSQMYHDFKMGGKKAPEDYIRVVKLAFRGDKTINPYLKRYLLEFINDTLDYKDYLDADQLAAIEGRKRDADGDRTKAEDDATGADRKAGEQDVDSTGGGAGQRGTDGTTGDRGTGRTDADERNAEFDQLSPREQSERLFQETGLESSSVEPLPAAVVSSEKAQIKRVSVVPVGDNEIDYQTPSSQADNQFNALLDLQDAVGGDIDAYVAEQLKFDSVATMRKGLMSLQVESVAAAIHQMTERGKSIIIGDQTGVGKGRQAGAVIRWAERNGKIPIFITEKPALYTDMYYDMVDTGTESVVPFITNSGEGVKERVKTTAQPRMLFSKPNTTKSISQIASSGRLPENTNAVFTTYDQLKSDPRKKAISKLIEDNDAVLIMDESHTAAGAGDGKKRASKINEYLTGEIKNAYGSIFLSATFAKKPENLAFYFNTDLSDAVDNMQQLVIALQNGGAQLQEVMSQALTRGGQLFRREISYEGIEIKTKFDKAKEARDRGYSDRITNHVRNLIETDFRINDDLMGGFSDPVAVALRLRGNNQIDDETLEAIQEQALIDERVKSSEKKLKVNYTPINNVIHNLMGNLMVAAKADGAVNEIIQTLSEGKKPVIGLDKTNAAILSQYVALHKLKPGDDVSGFNWASMIELYGEKAFNVSISFRGRDNWEAKGNVHRSDVQAQELIAELDAVVEAAKEDLISIDLPLSPIDYIAQKATDRAKAELGKTIVMEEITGRHNNGNAIDYSDGKAILKRLPPKNGRDIVDRFNGGTAEKPLKEGVIDGLIINRSGATGVSAHSSEKHGDRRERHMVIIEPAGDINIFQQMLGRIFRTGMGDTMPYYTVLGSSIPADARTIAVLRKKLESLNAQTSSNREGAAGVDVVDFIDHHGDQIVARWIEKNAAFSDLFPSWATKLAEGKLAYWASARIGLMPFSVQEEFFETVTDNYLAKIEEMNQAGTNDLEQQFHDWKAIPREEIKIAEIKGDGIGFKSGSWLVRYIIDKEFKPLTAAEVMEAVDANKDKEIVPAEETVTETIEKLEKLFEDASETLEAVKDIAPDYPSLFQQAISYMKGETEEFNGKTVLINQNMLDTAKQRGLKTKLESVSGLLKNAFGKAQAKVDMLSALNRFAVGTIIEVPPSEHAKAYQATVIDLAWKPMRENPWGLGNIQVTLAANGGGKAKVHTSLATLGNLTFKEGDVDRKVTVISSAPIESDYKYYHETVGDTSSTAEKWIAVGNPLLAASELKVRGNYLRFTDYKGRPLMGIALPDALIEKEGIEGTYLGTVEIPNAEVITKFFTDNNYGDFSTKRGFATRFGTIRITVDNYDSSKTKVAFRNLDGLEKLQDRNLQALLEINEITPVSGEDLTTFTVPTKEAGPIISEIMRRARIVVLSSDKELLRNYMTLPQPIKAQNKTLIPAGKADAIEYEGGEIAKKGTYKARSGKKFSGYYIYNTTSTAIRRINPLSVKMTNEGGGYFVFTSKFKDGSVDEQLGSPTNSYMDDTSALSVGGLVKGAKTAQVIEKLKALPFNFQRLVKVVQNESGLPAAVRGRIREQRLAGRVRGVFHKGKAYIVADNLYSPDQAIVVFLHEIIGHYGLRKLLGKDLKPFLNQVALRYPKRMKEMAKRYKLNLNTESGRLEAAEEIVAHIAEQGLNPTLMQRLITLFRKALRAIGFDLAITESEIASILKNAKQVVAQDGLETDLPLSEDVRMSVESSTTDGSQSVPEDTIWNAVRDGQPVDAAFRTLWKGVELTQLPRAVRATSAAALRGAMNFYDQYMPWAHPAFNAIARGMIDRYGLTDEFRALEVKIYSKQAEIINEVREIIKSLEEADVTSKEAKLIHEILVNEAPREEAWDSITEPIRKRIEALGQEAVELNLISQEAYDQNKGAYLHRVYMKYEQDKSGLEKWSEKLIGSRKPRIKGDETIQRGLTVGVDKDRLLGDLGITEDGLVDEGVGVTIYALEEMTANQQRVRKRTFSLEKPEVPEDGEYQINTYKYRYTDRTGKARIHRDWTKAERTAMGEITDARYTLGKTFALLAHDLAHGQFFKQIAANPEWTWLEEGEPENAAESEHALRMGISTGYEWVKVPTTRVHPKSKTKRYGALAGKYVRAEIYQHLNQIQHMQKPSFWKEVMTSFKLNKTARNPVVHFNNIMSNVVLMDMADVRFSDLYAAIREMSKKGALYDEAKRNGTFGASFAERELKADVLDKLLDDINEATGVKPVGLHDVFMSMDRLPMNKQIAFMSKVVDHIWNGVDVKGRKVGLREFDKKMVNYYQHEDEVFRMATYIRRRGQGMSEVEAGISARDQFLNYDITAPWINAAKATVLPFVSYTYRAVPIVAKSIVQRPWKMAKYFTIAYAVNALGYALSDGDEDKERKSLREEVSGKLWIGADRLLRMPWNDEHGNPYFWDVRRLIPVGDVFDLNQYHAALPIVPAPLMPSGPIALGFEFALNKTGFFGEEIVDPDADDPITGVEKSLDWAWKSYGPSAPWIPYSYYWDKVGIAVRGGRDRLGREYNVLEALASSVGVKISRHDVSYGMMLKGLEIERTVRAVRHQLNFLEKDYWQGKLKRGFYETRRRRYINQLKKQEERAKDLFR